jgi:hypothetical protein
MKIITKKRSMLFSRANFKVKMRYLKNGMALLHSPYQDTYMLLSEKDKSDKRIKMYLVYAKIFRSQIKEYDYCSDWFRDNTKVYKYLKKFL